MMECLEGLTDPRQEKKVLLNFIETIMLVICAVIAGCDVWEDMSCQKDIVKKISEKGTDYVIGLNDNQPALCQETRDYFVSALSFIRMSAIQKRRRKAMAGSKPENSFVSLRLPYSQTGTVYL